MMWREEENSRIIWINENQREGDGSKNHRGLQDKVKLKQLKGTISKVQP